MSLLDQRAAEAVDAILVGIRSPGAQLRALIAEADERLAAVENERGRRSLHGLEVAPAPRAHAASVRWHAGAHMSAAPIIPFGQREVPPAPPSGRVDRVWEVPVEMVVALTRSAYGEVIRKRATRGDAPLLAAKVWIHDKHFFATVDFADGRRSLVLQLAAWPWENGEGAP